ncbi:MAG: 3-oxoacyl-ACP reductase FabG [Betaproteobacteria bacterium]|nr:3-oxoacyl-ACP reductase FabG [Betaproteobacteria bacterium]
MTGKVALVTGASRGIGQAIARALGAAGFSVAGTATTAAGAQGITASFATDGLSGQGYELDVSSSVMIDDVFERIQKEQGEISVLVNNAGITRDNLLLRLKDDDWDSVMNTNLRSVFQLSKLAIRPMMKARWGRIINVTSVVGHSGNGGQTNYAAAKAGLTGFAKSLAREVGSRNITVNCVAPGFIDTDMTRTLNEAQRTALIGQVPLGRFGLVEEVAAAVAFLASDHAGYVTGSTIHVNGGMLMD